MWVIAWGKTNKTKKFTQFLNSTVLNEISYKTVSESRIKLHQNIFRLMWIKSQIYAWKKGLIILTTIWVGVKNNNKKLTQKQCNILFHLLFLVTHRLQHLNIHHFLLQNHFWWSFLFFSIPFHSVWLCSIPYTLSQSFR